MATTTVGSNAKPTLKASTNCQSFDSKPEPDGETIQVKDSPMFNSPFLLSGTVLGVLNHLCEGTFDIEDSVLLNVHLSSFLAVCSESFVRGN